MTTIGVVYPGDGRLPEVRSGVPFSLGEGLRAAGVDVCHVSADLMPPLDRACLHLLTAAQIPRAIRRGAPRTSRVIAYHGPAMGAVQTWTVHQRLRRAPDVDGIVQVGSSYALPVDTRTVTHDDMTVVQAVRAGYPGVMALSPRQRVARIERQRIAFERARACCVVTGWAARSIIEDYGIPASKVKVVGGGRNHEPHAVERDWSTPRYLFVGKDWERKNGPAVLRAFERLRRDVPDATLDVVGNHPPLAMEGVTTHGALRLSRPVERALLDALFERATCFVMPSRHEPSGIVFSEANAAGVPSIGSSEGGSRELIGDAGFVVHPDDDDALFAAMSTLADARTAQRLGANAQARSRLFTWEAVAQRVLRALDVPGIPADHFEPFLQPA